MAKGHRSQIKRERNENQKGLTMLEYCAGAAIIGLVVFVAMRLFGDGLIEATQHFGQWAAH